MTTPHQALAQAFQQLVEDYGLTMETLGSRIGISKQAVQQGLAKGLSLNRFTEWLTAVDDQVEAHLQVNEGKAAVTLSRRKPMPTLEGSVGDGPADRRITEEGIEKSARHWTHEEPNPGSYLARRFLEPLGLTIEQLARDLQVDALRLHRLLEGDEAIDRELALRLGHYFGVAAGFWLGLQAEYDLEQGSPLMEELPTVDSTGFIIGRAGAVAWASSWVPADGGAVTARIEPHEIETLRAAVAVSRRNRPAPEGPPDVRVVTYPNGRKALEIRRD